MLFNYFKELNGVEVKKKKKITTKTVVLKESCL